MADDLLFGGYRGPGGFMPAATTLTEPVTNAAGSDLLAGEVVRLNGNATVTRAQADVPANVIGLVGVMQAATPLGALGPVVSSGRAFVLLEPALVPVAGEALWVSATTAGRATNVAPGALPVYLGIIKDASGYGATGGVIADLAPSYTLSVSLNTLHAVYAAGTVAADQTMTLLNADGGGIIVDASNAGFTGTSAFRVTGTGGITDVLSSGGTQILLGSILNTTLFDASWGANITTLFVQVDNTVNGPVLLAVGNSPAGCALDFVKSRTADGVNPAIVQDNDLLGTIAFTGDDGVDVGSAGAAFVQTRVDGTPTASRVPGRILFATTSEGLVPGGPEERLRITSGGSSIFTANRTVAVPAAGTAWDAILGATSTLTLTAGGVAPNELAFARFQAPTITQTAGAPYVVPVAATVVIDGPPIADASGGQTPTITAPRALLVKAGISEFLNNVFIRVENTIGWELYTGNLGGQPGIHCGAGGTSFMLGSSYGIFFQPSGVYAGGWTANGALIVSPAFYTLPNTATRLYVTATATIASAGAAVWNGIDFAASTLTISGGPGTITALAFFNVAGPTITSAAANVVTDFYTQRIGAASFIGAGPASATRSYSLFSEGNTKFGGGMTFKGTDVNAAGPYVVLETDFFLEVRYTATGIITINLPSIATAGNGRVIAIIDSGYNEVANPITVARNGADTINNVAGNYTMNSVNGQCLWFKANATTNNWELV